MNNEINEQAVLLECLLPKMMRRLFSLEHDHPIYELPLAQLRVCTVLANGPKPMSAIGEELRISTSAITQLADRMERAGLVERVLGLEDRRVRELRLTKDGAEMMRSRRDARVRRASEALARLSSEQRDALLENIRALLQAAEATAPAPPSDDPVGIRVEQ